MIKKDRVTLSICIPTYNRAKLLENCLQSILLNKQKDKINYQVCISDNCSTDDTESIVLRAKETLDIKYRRNVKNLGIPKNFLNVVDMADGEFIWLLGDDDLLLPDAIERLIALIENNPDVDFYYINSCHLDAHYITSFPHPFDTKNLPTNMTAFSSWKQSGRLGFLELVNPKVSFDFLGGIYLSVFRKENWSMNVGVLDDLAIADVRTFSNFDNTFPHIKIFAKAFSKSEAYFSSDAFSVCLSGAREWAPMYPLVHSVRLVEALDEYRKNGLPFFRYLQCKNYALNTFIPHLVMMFLNKKSSGSLYMNPFKLMLANCIYPNFYLSVFYYFFRKLKNIISRDVGNH